MSLKLNINGAKHRRYEEMAFRAWSDGTQQWFSLNIDGANPVYLERMIRPAEPTRGWCLVTRNRAMSTAMYPPVIAGPYPDVDSALLAYRFYLDVMQGEGS